MTETLSTTEQSDLAQLESVIEKGLQGFREMGEALLAIRSRKLYRSQYGTFARYLKERWGFGASYGYMILGAAEVCANLKNSEVQPDSEHVCRALVRLEPKQQRRVWSAAITANNGEAPTAKQIAELRRELYPDSYEQAPNSEPTSDQGDVSPEDWLSQGQQLARDQRLSEWRIADWYNYGEDRFGQANKLIDEVIWSGPPIAAIRRKAAVARQFPADKRKLELSFETFNAAASIGQPELVSELDSEEQIKAAVTEVRRSAHVEKVKAAEGQPIQSDELRESLDKFWPRIWQGVLYQYGASLESKIIDYVSEFIQSRRESLLDKRAL